MLVFFNGLLLGLSLIMALGPQNIFLIRQGARRNHATLSTVICFICDISLICASVLGLHTVLVAHPFLQSWMIWLGSAFLIFYAAKALQSALFTRRQKSKDVITHYNRLQVVLFALSFSILNPHAIIDSLVIIGGGSSQFPNDKFTFSLGVISASFIWFSSLTLTTRYFSNVLTKTSVWKAIELLSGLIMAFIGIKLALSGV